MKYIIERVREYMKRKAVRARFRKVVSVLCCIVVFMTTYSLVMPSLALEKDADCGQEEHEHSADCYTRELICGQEESEEHQHTDECYEDVLSCGMEVHVHTEDCFPQEEPEEEEPEEVVQEEPEEEFEEESVVEEEQEEPEEVGQEEQEEPAQEEANDAGQDQHVDSNETNTLSPGAEGGKNSDQTDDMNDFADVDQKDSPDFADHEKLDKIDFAKILTDDSGIYYLPEGGDNDDWKPVNKNVKLDPEQEVLIHIAYRVPAGRLNQTNRKTEYYLPLGISLTEEQVEFINNNRYTVYEGTDRNSNNLLYIGEYEIKEKKNGQGKVTERKLVIRFNEYAAEKAGGEKLTDGTVVVKPQKLEGFIEMPVFASELLGLEKDGDAAYKIEWNDDRDLDTTIYFDEEKLDAFLNAQNGNDIQAEAAQAEAAQAETDADTADEETVDENANKGNKKKIVVQEMEEDEEEVSEEVTEENTEEKLAEETPAENTEEKLAEETPAENTDEKSEEETPAENTEEKSDEETPAENTEEKSDEETPAVEEAGKDAENPEEASAQVEGEQSEADAAADDADQSKADAAADDADQSKADAAASDKAAEEAHEYKLTVGESASLTQILTALEIKTEDEAERFVSEEVEDVQVSNADLIEVDHKGKILWIFGKEDWTITANDHFMSRETLTVTTKDGEVLEIILTDAALVACEDGKTYEVSASGETYEITLAYGAESGLPAEGVTLDVTEITPEDDGYDAYLAETEGAVGDSRSVNSLRLFDIKIIVFGKEVEPTGPVNVSINMKDMPVQKDEEVQVVHFQQEGQTEVLDSENVQVLGSREGENTETANGEAVQADQEGKDVSGVTFTTDGFSVYGVVYTVDFHWQVGGNMYDFSIPGGGFVSFEHLVEVLGIAGSDASSENKEATSYDEAVKLNEVEVSEAAKKFVADVTSVEFSNPELVWIGKTDSAATVGGLKEAKGLEVEYSAELTKEQIAEINAQTVEAGDWALISLRAFTSEEMLTVTMKTGEVFAIRVTDYQISTNVLTADGKTYKITVTFDDDAEIPAGTKLVASEIEPGTDEYNEHLGKVWEEKNKEYFEIEEMRKNYDESMGVLPDVHYVNINTARFFRVSLVNNNKEIEPKAPVQVEISYIQGLETRAEAEPGVVAYGSEDRVDIVDNVETIILDNKVTSFRYKQDSLLEVGTYVGQEASDEYTEPKLAAAPDPSGTPSTRNVNLNEETLETIVRSSKKSSGLLRGAKSEEPDTEDTSSLQKPEAHKSLTANTDEDGNEDGTYTLRLSVKGHSSISYDEQVKKSNVLVVMDRSSSMITRTVNDEEAFWYYGTWNQNEYTFRGDIRPDTGYRFYGVINGQYVELNVSSSWSSWNNYNLQYWNGWRFVDYPQNSPLYVRSKTTRMVAEQNALSALFSQLMDMNAVSGDNRDIIELSVISFGDQRFDLKSWSSETEVDWQSGRDTSALMNGVMSNRFTSGTNWEEALEYAYSVISAKKAQDGADEDYYVIFLTDGEPTAIHGNKPGEVPYQNDDNIIAYNAAKDDAKKLVDEQYKFYNIFTYRTTEKEKYSIYLTNYAYGNGDYNENKNTEAVQKYFTDAQTVDSLNDAFNDIFFTIEDSIGHGNVSITDTLTTDAMTTTIVQGKTNGYVYEVKDENGAVLYTVTSTGDLNNPTVVFHVPNSSTADYTATASEVAGKTVYSVRTDEGKLYKMALADVNDTTGELIWDLSSVGILMNNCTYSVNFIVWPDQEAYDYVAALNNGLEGYTWDTHASTYEDLRDTKGYEKGGVVRFPSIVKKTDGTFAVLTNTDQKLHYSVIETTTDGTTTETTINGPYYHDLETPDPMPLTASSSEIEKVWNIERDPAILAQLLYDHEGNPEEYSIGFNILQDDDASTDRDDSEKAYTTVTLGWDPKANNNNGAYVWEPDSEQTVHYNGHDCVVGSRWVSDFSIATGLMLSEERMDELGLDKTAYPSGEYQGVKYYVLETGHDYTIKEPGLTFEFDFQSPIYHPMLVDGVLRSVNLAIDEMNVSITSMTSAEEELSSLKIENTLRGYINLNKVVVDSDGTTPVPGDQTKFEYTIELENANGPFTVEGSHVPWYGINGLFYHDEEFNYYQATPAGTGHVRLVDEKGNTYDAACEGTFIQGVGPVPVSFTDTDGTEKTIQLYGNQMNHDSDNRVTATLKISQGETLNIANVPVGTEYTITESDQSGYEFVRIEKEIKLTPEDDEGISETITESSTITGTIVTNRDNQITYYNKTLVTDITIQKVDTSGTGLEGAVFQMKTVSRDGHEEALATTIDTISGIGDVTKIVNGESKVFESSFESTGGIQTISGLPDGTYRLYEVYVPAGYISTYRYIQFDIENRVIKNVTTDTGDTSKLDTTADNIDLKIANEPGVALPHTGGPGTYLIYLFGIMLTAVAGAGMALKKKMRIAA